MATPKGTLRGRFLKKFQQKGIVGFSQLAKPILLIWLEKFLISMQSRLPFAYERWQSEFERPFSASLPDASSLSPRIAFVYSSQGHNDSISFENGSPANVLSIINTSHTGPDNHTLRFIQTDNEGEFLQRCTELAGSEKLDWLVFTHADAVLAPQLCAGLLSQPESVDCIYWDEDRFSRMKKRKQPFFKPAWSPEMWLSLDLLDTFAVRPHVLREAPSQPSLAHLKAWIASSVTPVHMPQVWTHLKPIRFSADRLRLEQHAKSVVIYLSKQGMSAIQVNPDPSGVLRSEWAYRAEKVSIIIPTRNNIDYVKRCIESLIDKTEYPDYEIILVDNQSTDQKVLALYADFLGRYQNIRILPYNEAFNFSRACNIGASIAKGSLYLFLNNDVEITSPGWLAELVRVVQLPGVGAAGAQLFYPDGKLQHSGIVVGMTGHANHVGARENLWKNSPYGSASARRNCSAVTAACILIRAQVFQQIAGFEEDYRLVFNDVEICLRVLRAGWRIVLTPSASLIHYEGRSRSRYIPPEDIRLAYHDLAGWVKNGDPYYSSNLSLAVSRPVFRSKMEMSALERMKIITMSMSEDET